MSENDFLVWAGGTNANVLTQTAYSGLTNLTSGVVSGKASGQQANKTWRQSSIMATVIANFIQQRLNVDVIDDGTTATITSNFISAITSLFVIPNTGVTPGTYGPTIAITVEADGRITSLANANLQGTGLTQGTYVAPTITVGSDGRIDSITSVSYGPLAGVNQWTATNTFSAGVDITGFDSGGVTNGMQMRAIQGGYGAGFRNDGSFAYLLQTANGGSTGAWNAYRPFYWNLSTGSVTIDGTGAGAAFGGPVTVPGVLTLGTGGAYFNPNQSGSVVLSFGSSEYLQLTPGNGFLLNSTGTANITAPNGVSISTPTFLTTGTIGATGNITANNGKLRASIGAFKSGDNNCAVILNDYDLQTNGNNGYSYLGLPNGFILQSNIGTTVTGADFIAFPNSFPNACFTVLCHEGAPSGWNLNGVLSPTVFGTQQITQTNFALYCARNLPAGSSAWQLTPGITFRYIAIGA